MLRFANPVATACLLFATACMGAPSSERGPAQDGPISIRCHAQPFKIDEPSARRIGRLIWRGGVAMEANSPNFGGWSELQVAPDRQSLTSISDEGSWLTATIEYDKDGNLTCLGNARIGPLHGLDGQPLASKEWSDSEGSARLPDGTWLVSFEQHHRIWHYPTLTGTPVPIDSPPGIETQPRNGGIETLTALPDGTVIAISEELIVRPGMLAGWSGRPTGGGHYSWQTFEYAKIPDFNPTAINRLPDGSFVLLERAFDVARGVRIRVMHVAASAIAAGATVRAEELARLASPYAVDNLEGVAAARGPRGETLLWLIADDNFNPLQRNLLLMFELAP